MNNEVMLHIEESLNEVRSLFTKTALKIEALKPGEKIPATKLADELALEFKTKGATLYPTLKILIDGYPGVKVLRGAHGGIYKLPETVDTAPADVKVENQPQAV